MTIDELIVQFGYTRRILILEQGVKPYDTNLGLLRAGTDTPGNYQVIEKVWVGPTISDLGIRVTDEQAGIRFIIYDTGNPADDHAYDGDEEWKEAEKARLGLTDAELEIKIHLG